MIQRFFSLPSWIVSVHNARALGLGDVLVATQSGIAALHARKRTGRPISLAARSQSVTRTATKPVAVTRSRIELYPHLLPGFPFTHRMSSLTAATKFNALCSFFMASVTPKTLISHWARGDVLRQWLCQMLACSSSIVVLLFFPVFILLVYSTRLPPLTWRSMELEGAAVVAIRGLMTLPFGLPGRIATVCWKLGCNVFCTAHSTRLGNHSTLRCLCVWHGTSFLWSSCRLPVV